MNCYNLLTFFSAFNSHRVSFGENGSMVETLIIDSNMPAEEKHFYQENILREKHTGNVTADLNKGRLKDE